MKRPAVAASVVLGLGAGCLEPLPEPTSCDPPARVIGDACVPCDPPRRWVDGECLVCPPPSDIPYTRCVPNSLLDYGAPPDGCLASDLKFERFSCLAGEDPSCNCSAAPADDAPATCFSDGACPDNVQALDPSVRCFPAKPSDVRWADVPDASRNGCYCGCIEELARCDGRGILLGNYAGGMNAAPIVMDALRVTLHDLPPRGTLGVYVRARGFALPLAVAFVPTDPVFAWAFYVTGDYTELLGFGPDQDGIDASFALEKGFYRYDEATRPTDLVVQLTDLGAMESTVNTVEIDCVIPFVVPDAQ